MTKTAARAAVLAVFGLAVAAPTTHATFHEMSIREVYPGSIASPGAEFVELQMWAPGQNLVGGHSLRTYDKAGGLVETTTFAEDVSGSANQSTILLATTAAESFGVTPDAEMTEGQLDPAGGAVCWESLDCVSWGSFAGPLPSPAGPPATPGGIPDGMALRRTITPSCATLLEPTDDHDNSAADFSAVFPNPRPNSVAPSEHACASVGGPQGSEGPSGQSGGRRQRAPQTRLTRKPPHRTGDATPTFRFVADEDGVRFQCRMDGGPFRSCSSPFTSKPLRRGRHVFEVRARDKSGKRDPSPARCGFKVLVRRG
jgi:hypothetical protein